METAPYMCHQESLAPTTAPNIVAQKNDEIPASVVQRLKIMLVAPFEEQEPPPSPAAFQTALSKVLLAHVGNHSLLLREMIGEMIDDAQEWPRALKKNMILETDA